MCEKGQGVVLELPAEIDEGKETRTITADKCCVDILKYLWDNGIDTRGHCCGHGECNPSIVVPEGYHRIGIARTLILIEQVDDREWDILQWQLTKMNSESEATDGPFLIIENEVKNESN